MKPTMKKAQKYTDKAKHEVNLTKRLKYLVKARKILKGLSK